MRGKDVEFEEYKVCVGITPAYAGKSKLKLRRSLETRDHPRVCGEKVFL